MRTGTSSSYQSRQADFVSFGSPASWPECVQDRFSQAVALLVNLLRLQVRFSQAVALLVSGFVLGVGVAL